MKKLLFTICCMSFGLAGAMAQTAPPPKPAPAPQAQPDKPAPPDPKGPKFTFKEGESYDFKEIPEGPIAEHVFEFKNTGKEPLIIQNASASCGCTTPEWPKEPIMPGKKSKITVRYNTQGRVGMFHKDVYIQSNAVNLPDGKQRFELHISGTVKAAEKPSAPATQTNK